MSNTEKLIEYPLSALVSFYETSGMYYLRSEEVLKDLFQEKVEFTSMQKESLYDILTASRVICSTVEDIGVLEYVGKQDVIKIGIGVAKILSGLLKGLSDSLDELHKMGVDLLSTH